MKNDYIIAVFNDEQPLMAAIKKLRDGGTEIHEAYTPYPVHGLDTVLGYKRSRLATAAFMFGTVGFMSGLGMQAYMLSYSKWRINIGGKPYLAWPDFVPVTFEFTVLVTALGMVATYLIANKFYPGAPSLQPDPRVTDDKFCLAIRTDKVAPGIGDFASHLRDLGAEEVRTDNIEL